MSGAPFPFLSLAETRLSACWRMWRCGFGAALLLVATACGQENGGPEAGTQDEPPAKPALWRVADADTTIYLFGTIHMLPDGATWRSPALDQAFAGAKALYLEADVEGDPTQLVELVRRLGQMPPPQRLSGQLTPPQASRLIAAAGRLGYSLPALEMQRPWYAAVTLSDAAIRTAGFGSMDGVETVLRREARASGKPVRFLETVERQLTALADLPENVQVSFLDMTLSDVDNVQDDLTTMVKAWRAGDAQALTRLLIDDDIGRLPELKDALLVHRNADWADQLKSLLDAEPGQFFVAVGAAHLLGDRSVLADLAANGVTADRIQ